MRDMLRVEFEIKGAAFAEAGGAAWESARILREIAGLIDNGAEYGTVRDVNGNKLGDWFINLPESEEGE